MQDWSLADLTLNSISVSTEYSQNTSYRKCESISPGNLSVFQVGWVSWMDSSTVFTMVPDTNYCDIIVPTMNTVQMAYLLEMLLTNHKPVSVLNFRQINLELKNTNFLLLIQTSNSTVLPGQHYHQQNVHFTRLGSDINLKSFIEQNLSGTVPVVH